jgi:hypothetical protein
MTESETTGPEAVPPASCRWSVPRVPHRQRPGGATAKRDGEVIF